MRVRLLILGTGGMAQSHAEAFAAIDGVDLVAGVDPDPARLAAFCATHGIERAFATLEGALAWGGFDAVANVTPDPVHHPTTMALLAAGKHVLCEKPLATNHADAGEMAAAAEQAGVVNMVNLTYRNAAALTRAAAMVAAGAIGEVRHFDACYLQSWLTQPVWGAWSAEDKWLWRLSTAHGSMGALGDTGIHVLDFATFIAGSQVVDISCRLKTFDKAPGGRIGQYVLDANDSAVLHVGLQSGAIGAVQATRFASGHINDLRVRIFGTKGGLDASSDGKISRLRACLEPDLTTATWRDVTCPEVPSNQQSFIEAIRSGGAALPDFARGAALQKVLDRAVESDRQGGKVLAVRT